MGPLGPFGSFWAKGGILTIFPQNSTFLSFLRFFILQNYEAHISVSKEILTHKNCQKGCPKASKMANSLKTWVFQMKSPVN